MPRLRSASRSSLHPASDKASCLDGAPKLFNRKALPISVPVGLPDRLEPKLSNAHRRSLVDCRPQVSTCSSGPPKLTSPRRQDGTSYQSAHGSFWRAQSTSQSASGKKPSHKTGCDLFEFGADAVQVAFDVS